MALGDARRVERPGEPDDDAVVGRPMRGRIAELDAADLVPVDQAFGPQEADGQLVLVARRPHRHGDRDRLLARSGSADLERLLADDPVGADLERAAAHGNDPRRRDVAGQARCRTASCPGSLLWVNGRPGP